MPTSIDITNLRINQMTRAQYNDAVANHEIGDTDIVSIIDEGHLEIKNKGYITLTQNAWFLNEQSVFVEGVTPTNTIMVNPAPASTREYVAKGINCIKQGNGVLTFSCISTPEHDLSVSVVILS